MGSESISSIEKLYQQAVNKDSDINSHLPTIKKYAEGCDRILELGFRKGVSALALLSARPKFFLTIDWDREPFEVDSAALREYTQLCQETKLEFRRQDSLEAKKILSMGKFDLLFIDTFHTYEHLFLELIVYADHVNKHIIIHDTEDFSCPGMFNAIEDFLLDNPQWSLAERICERPGLTILSRVRGSATWHYSLAFRKTLEREVCVQKEMYYEQIGPNGSANPEWRDYIMKMVYRFKDPFRWPLTNKRIGATELAKKYSADSVHQIER